MHIITQIVLQFLQMLWDIAWGLGFGFMLSSVIRAFIPTETISQKLGKNSVGAVGLATFFGAISSSCSYAAASMARTLVMKGATWPNAVAFMVSSTNLVFEIFIVIVTLLGWSFFGGEVVGGFIFIIISAALLVWFFPKSLREEAVAHIKKSDPSADPHAHHHGEMMEMEQDPSTQKQTEKTGFKQKLTQASGHFYMDVTMVGKDILIGVILSAIIMVLVPETFWKSLFLSGNSSVPHFLVLCWNALIGILIAIFAFVCSVGNIVMAGVLWRGGISFGGVIAFILSDLVTIPMLLVYRKYFGIKTMLFLLAVLSLSIFVTALTIDVSFEASHWIPKHQSQSMQMEGWKFKWNYASYLNLFFIPLSVVYFFFGRKAMK